MKLPEPPVAQPRIALVLSAGGLRGAAHVGVLRALVREGIKIDVLVGVSAGAVIAAYYAAAGLTLDDLADDAVRFRGRHLLWHSLNVQLGQRFDAALAPRCGIIPERLRRLEAATFETLHHGIEARQRRVRVQKLGKSTACIDFDGVQQPQG